MTITTTYTEILTDPTRPGAARQRARGLALRQVLQHDGDWDLAFMEHVAEGNPRLSQLCEDVGGYRAQACLAFVGWVGRSFTGDWGDVLAGAGKALADAGNGILAGAPLPRLLGLKIPRPHCGTDMCAVGYGAALIAEAIAGAAAFEGIGELGVATDATETGSGAVAGDALGALSASEQRAVSSLQQQVADHMAKLEAYRANPAAYDNLRILERAATPEIRQSIIDGRIRHLEGEIRTFQEQIDKLLGGAG